MFEDNCSEPPSAHADLSIRSNLNLTRILRILFNQDIVGTAKRRRTGWATNVTRMVDKCIQHFEIGTWRKKTARKT
jgi:hypothetical protein